MKMIQETGTDKNKRAEKQIKEYEKKSNILGKMLVVGLITYSFINTVLFLLFLVGRF